MFFLFSIVSRAQRVAVSSNSPTVNYSKGMEYLRAGNSERGIGYIKLAAGKGHAEAAFVLGEAYRTGSGVPIDYQEAGYWYEIAAKKGNNNATQKFQELVSQGLYKPNVEKESGQNVQIIQYNIGSNMAANIDNLDNPESPAKSYKFEKIDNGLKSDVDTDIPVIKVNNGSTIVIIIANEHYQEEEDVEYANNDGTAFRDYCIRTLGVPENQIRFRKDATLNNLLSEIDWLEKIVNTNNFKDKANVIFYYSGHGIPDEATGSSYILPIDGKGNMINTAYSMNKLYDTLSELPVKQSTVFMDACFSGSKRGNGMLVAARGVKIKTKMQEPKNNVIVFSAAMGDETAYPYKDKEHGLFTYYLLKKVQETKGDCTYGELSTYLHDKVTSQSLLENGKSQTPTTSTTMSNWKEMRLK